MRDQTHLVHKQGFSQMQLALKAWAEQYKKASSFHLIVNPGRGVWFYGQVQPLEPQPLTDKLLSGWRKWREKDDWFKNFAQENFLKLEVAAVA